MGLRSGSGACLHVAVCLSAMLTPSRSFAWIDPRPCPVQVQDVGLIFLSAMATSIAGLSAAEGFSAQEALGTTLVTLVIATLLVGMLIVLVGAHTTYYMI